MCILRRLEQFLDHLLFGGKMSLKTKLTHLVLLHSFFIIILFIGLFYYGIDAETDVARDMGISLGKESYLNSTKRLIDSQKKELLDMAVVMSSILENRLKRLEDKTWRIKTEMEKIHKHPEFYTAKNLDYIDEFNSFEDSHISLHYPQQASQHELPNDIGMALNVSEVMTRIIDGSNIVTDGFVASSNDWVLSVENSQLAKDYDTSYDDMKNSDWYQIAFDTDDKYFSAVKEFGPKGAWAFYCTMPYYDASGNKAGVIGTIAPIESFLDLMKKGNIYNGGTFTFVLDSDGRVIMSTEDQTYEGYYELISSLNSDLRKSKNEGVSYIANEMTKGNLGVDEVIYEDETYFVAYAPVGRSGWSVGMGVNRGLTIEPAVKNYEYLSKLTDDKIAELEDNVRLGLLLFIPIFGLLTYLFTKSGKKLSERFVNPIFELSNGVRSIASGNIDQKLSISTGDEIEYLAECFNAMTDELKVYMNNVAKAAAERAHLAAELDVAAHIQKSTLPNTFPAFPGHKEFDIYAYMKPAKEVGGDFYDFYMIDDNHLVMTIADVSDKGVAASLFMVISKTVMKNFAVTLTGSDDLAPLVSCTNEQLCKENGEAMFVTAFVGMLELSTGRLSFVNAGHNPPLLYSAKENLFQYLQVERNFVLGGMEGIEFVSQELFLSPGDKLFLYTDGVTEALDESMRMYGEKRLLDCLNESDAANITPEAMIDDVRKSLKGYVGTADQSDDITMLAINYAGAIRNRPLEEELVIAASTENLPALNEFIEKSFTHIDVTSKIKNRVNVVIEELFTNISNYAYNGIKGPVTIRKALWIDSRRINITLIDEGIPYNPLSKDDPDVTLDADDRPIGGLGVYLFKCFVDDKSYEYRDGKNILTLSFNLSQ